MLSAHHLLRTAPLSRTIPGVPSMRSLIAHGWEKAQPNAAPGIPSEPRPSELQLGSQLHIARRQIASHRAKVCACVVKVGIHSIEVYAVEQIEDVNPELQIEPFCNLSAFAHCQVGICVAWVAEGVHLFIALHPIDIEPRCSKLAVR